MPAHKLVYRSPETLPISSLPPPPQGTERTFVETPTGRLELLVSRPTGQQTETKGPILFLHGGFGSAECYSNYLPYFAARGYPSYSVSLRGHGNSWYPTFFRMMFTSKHSFATDLATVVSHVSSLHGGQHVALVGHSAGGGLSQYGLHSGLINARALVLLGSFPNFGGFLVYFKWFLLDPWFPIRVVKDLYHPRSPLSSTNLVRAAFFSKEYPEEKVQAFERRMPQGESLAWPSQMNSFCFVSCTKVLKRIFNTAFGSTSTDSQPSEKTKVRPKVLVVAGENDALMGVRLMRWTAQSYARAANTTLTVLSSSKKDDDSNASQEAGDSTVSFYVSAKAPHNMMKDLLWEDSAEQVAQFMDRVG